MSFSQDPFLYDVLNCINYINYNTSFKTVLLTLYEFDNKSKKFKLNFKNYKKIKRKNRTSFMGKQKFLKKLTCFSKSFFYELFDMKLIKKNRKRRIRLEIQLNKIYYISLYSHGFQFIVYK